MYMVVYCIWLSYWKTVKKNLQMVCLLQTDPILNHNEEWRNILKSISVLSSCSLWPIVYDHINANDLTLVDFGNAVNFIFKYWR